MSEWYNVCVKRRQQKRWRGGDEDEGRRRGGGDGGSGSGGGGGEEKRNCIFLRFNEKRRDERPPSYKFALTHNHLISLRGSRALSIPTRTHTPCVEYASKRRRRFFGFRGEYKSIENIKRKKSLKSYSLSFSLRRARRLTLFSLFRLPPLCHPDALPRSTPTPTHFPRSDAPYALQTPVFII